MEPDKEKIIKLIQDVLEDPKLKGLTNEEKSVVIFEHVIEPLSKDICDYYSRIAWAYGNYPSPGRSN